MTEKPAEVTLGILNNTVLMGFGEIRKDIAAVETMVREVAAIQRADHDAIIEQRAKMLEHERRLMALDVRDRIEAILLGIGMIIVAVVPVILKFYAK